MAWQIEQVQDFSSAEKGQEIALKLFVDGGKQKASQVFYLSVDKIGELIAAISGAAGMARRERIKQNPAEEANDSLASGVVMNLRSTLAGVSTNVPGTAIFTLQFRGNVTDLLNIPVAAGLAELRTHAAAIQQCIDLLEQDPQPKPRLDA